jgi:ubiquinone/menaquinone biosynthesis C-methylase UbiE
MKAFSVDTKTAYSSKAEKYARYRWDYSPLAIQAVFDSAHITRASSIADIGAGTGILTRHFVGRAGRVWAIEPNAEMRQMAEKCIGQPHAEHTTWLLFTAEAPRALRNIPKTPRPPRLCGAGRPFRCQSSR